MNDNQEWQAQMSEERMRQELAALVKLERYGMHELAEFFAADLGLTNEFQQEMNGA